MRPPPRRRPPRPRRAAPATQRTPAGWATVKVTQDALPGCPKPPGVSYPGNVKVVVRVDVVRTQQLRTCATWDAPAGRLNPGLPAYETVRIESDRACGQWQGTRLIPGNVLTVAKRPKVTATAAMRV